MNSPLVVRNEHIKFCDLDIEYEVRVRRKEAKKSKGFPPRMWKLVLRTPSLKHALSTYERHLALGKRVRVTKYTIEVVREELFVGPPKRST